jgi:hypothetical protein
MADGPIRTGINQRESQFRSEVDRISNMGPTLQNIAAQTAGPEQFNVGDIPSVGYLANLKAGAQMSSQARGDMANRQINRLPQYVKGYRSYLQWRYPTRYGGGDGGYGSSSGGASTDYTGILGPLPGITGVPGVSD